MLVFHVAEDEYQFAGLARCKAQPQAMRGNRTPSVSDTLAGAAFQNGLRGIKSVVHPHKALPVGVKSVNRHIDSIEGIMIPSLPVLGFVINDAALNLDLARG